MQNEKKQKRRRDSERRILCGAKINISRVKENVRIMLAPRANLHLLDGTGRMSGKYEEKIYLQTAFQEKK